MFARDQNSELLLRECRRDKHCEVVTRFPPATIVNLRREYDRSQPGADLFNQRKIIATMANSDEAALS